MAGIILPNGFQRQPQYGAELADPGFWRLVDIQDRPPLGTAEVTRTLNNTASLKYGVGGAAVDFAAAGDWISYGENPDLQLSTMTGIAVIEVPNTTAQSTLFNTRVSGSSSGGFIIRVDNNDKISIAKLDIAAIATTAKAVKRGAGVSNVAWSYNNVTGRCRIAIDGTLESFTSAQTLAHGEVGRNKYYSTNNTYSNPHKQYLFALSASDAVSDAQLVEWSVNPWRIFKAPARRLWVVTSSGGITGTVAYTNANDTSAASGTTTVTGSSATTNANDTSAASGTTTVTGSSATTNADDTSSASGSVGSSVSGTVAYTNVDDTSAATGTTTVTGTSATTNANDTSSASGTTTVTGSSASTNAADTSAASGTTTVTGSSATTNADDTCSASGTVEEPEIIGTVAVTNANDTVAASGTTTVTGSVAKTNNNDTSTAYGVINNGIVVEAALTTGIAATISIKKPGIPENTPAWLRIMLEILIGRRGNKIEIPEHESLTFSATPTKAECEALYSYVNEVRNSLESLVTRFDS